MRLDNRLQYLWWVILVTSLTYFFISDVYGRVASGSATTMDTIIFVVWLALLLVPLFQEVDLFGVRLRSEIESMKNDVREQILNLRSVIQTTQNVQTFVFDRPPPDSELPKIEKQFRKSLGSTSVTQPRTMDYQKTGIDVPPDVQLLMSVRYEIEKQLRRLWEVRYGQPLRPFGLRRVIDQLTSDGMLAPALASTVREAYVICSQGVHGDPVSKSQIKFVRDVYPALIEVMKGL